MNTDTQLNQYNVYYCDEALLSILLQTFKAVSTSASNSSAVTSAKGEIPASDIKSERSHREISRSFAALPALISPCRRSSSTKASFALRSASVLCCRKLSSIGSVNVNWTSTSVLCHTDYLTYLFCFYKQLYLHLIRKKFTWNYRLKSR